MPFISIASGGTKREGVDLLYIPDIPELRPPIDPILHIVQIVEVGTRFQMTFGISLFLDIAVMVWFELRGELGSRLVPRNWGDVWHTADHVQASISAYIGSKRTRTLFVQSPNRPIDPRVLECGHGPSHAVNTETWVESDDPGADPPCSENEVVVDELQEKNSPRPCCLPLSMTCRRSGRRRICGVCDGRNYRRSGLRVLQW